MGYSCTQYADNTLNEIQKLLNTTYNFDICNKISEDKFFEISDIEGYSKSDDATRIDT